MTHFALHISIVLFSLAGLALANYIRTKKRGPEPLVCPVGFDCEGVVRSEYATFLGLPVEILGIGYYGVVLFGHALFLFVPAAMTVESMFALLSVTTVAFLFSCYLTAIQALVLRRWCTWCLGSSGIAALIFVFSLAVSRFGAAELLAENAYAITLIQSLALAVGVGGATIATLFYTKALADLDVSVSEFDVLHTLVQVLWIALAAVLLTGIGLYVPSGRHIADYSPPTVAALAITLALSVINFALYYLVAPKLVLNSAGAGHERAPEKMRRLRRVIFALSALSLVSWYVLFVLRLAAPQGAGVGFLLLIYAAALLCATFFALVYEQVQVKYGAKLEIRSMKS